MIEEYLALKSRLKKRNMEERGDLMDRRRDLEENFEPVVASNKKMAKEIVDELTPITEELRELNDKAQQRQKQLANTSSTVGVKRDIDSQPRSKQRRVYGPLTDSFLQKYMDPKKSQIDTTFGIRYENGVWMIGNKQIKINGDDIIIDGEVYNGTPGLWSLITDKTHKQYDNGDLERYKELLHETSAMHQNYDSRSRYPRASGSKKWTQILAPIWNEFEMTGVVTSTNDDDETDSIDGTLVDKDGADDEDEFHDSRTMFDDDDRKSADGDGMKMYLQKDGRCFDVQKTGRGITFTPRPKLAGIRGNGLYLRVGSDIYDGHGLILGPRSPFKNIPILGWIL